MEASTRVEQILTAKGRDVHTASPDDTVLSALEQMARHNVGALAVVEDGRLVGMFSERDYARKVILQGRASKDTPVSQGMTGRVITVSTGDNMSHCMKLMTDHRIRHLPVVDDGELVGMISVGDVVKTVMEEQRFMIEQLESYIRS